MSISHYIAGYLHKPRCTKNLKNFAGGLLLASGIASLNEEKPS